MRVQPPLTRRDALIQWERFLPKVFQYGDQRNFVADGHSNVSMLGAALRFRTVLEDEIIGDTLGGHGFERCEKWLQEVCWRRYWKGWLERRPQVWTKWRARVRAFWRDPSGSVWERARRVMNGQSGVACMDAMARELVETGYLHNHARMWWASFWVHVERLPWELGADFFFRHLLDADPASNTLSWRWVAGLQTPGKTYLVRLSNIEKFAPGYLRPPALGNERLTDGMVTACRVADATDLTVQSLREHPASLPATDRRSGLWLHPDDLLPEIGPLSTLKPLCVAAYLCDGAYQNEFRLSSRRIESIHTVTRDGLERAGAHYKCPAHALSTVEPVEALCQWAVSNGLREIVAFAPMVGPGWELLGRLAPRLEASGIRLTLVRRASDAVAFELASAGFFPFWEKMKERLKREPPVERALEERKQEV
jgi:deoxyribodipyrimidine photo-lyase